jgi:hypothetical protein
VPKAPSGDAPLTLSVPFGSSSVKNEEIWVMMDRFKMPDCNHCGAVLSPHSQFCSICGAQVRKKRGLGFWLLGCAVLLAIPWVLTTVFYIVLSSGGKQDSKAGISERSRSPREIALSQVKLKYSWSKDAVVMTANFTIQNESEYVLKDFEIHCLHFAPSGTLIDQNTRTIYEIIKPHSAKRIPQFNMGFINSQAASSNCRIQNLAIVTTTTEQ